MKAAKKLFDDGRFTIVQGVGYPNPNRSHFESMRIWQTARLDAEDRNGYGWLGRALDADEARLIPGQPSAIYVGPEQAPVALWGRRSETATVAKIVDAKLPFDAQQMIPASANTTGKESSADELGLFTTRQVLKIVSQLIQSNSSAGVFYTSQGGYDTHASQLYTHAGLLRNFSEAVTSFLDDLKAKSLEDRVVVLAFSEFGRRVKENDSQGTDHGAAGPVFLAGSRTSGGLIGTTPDLGDLENDDVKMTIDLRQIYATILEDWLRLDAKAILGADFGSVPIIRS